MKKLLFIAALSTTILVGCGNQGENADQQSIIKESSNSVVIMETEEEVEEVEEAEVKEEIIVNQEIVDKLKEKFSYSNSYEMISTRENIVKFSLPSGYIYNVTNSVDDNGVETIATIKSPEIKGYIYNIKVYDIPLDKEDFLVANPLKIEETKNQDYNNFINLVSIDNKKVDLPIKIFDNTGKEFNTYKYEIYTDLSILMEDGIGIYREPPTYYMVQGDDSIIALMISEEKVDIPKEESENESETNDNEESELTSNEINTESLDEEKHETIIEEVDAEENTDMANNEDIKAIYDSLDNETKKCIDNFKIKFLAKGTDTIQAESLIREESTKRIDEVGISILNNMMLGRFN